MKIIITESQHNKLQMKQWLLRRQELFMSEYNDALTQTNPCNHDDSNSYVNRVIHYTMDGLHPHFYQNHDFDYELLFEVIFDMVYVDLTEKYNSEIKNCQ
jgi:hypothetical protein